MSDSEENGQICLLILLIEGQITTCSWFLCTVRLERNNDSFESFCHYCIDTGLIAGPERQPATALVLVRGEKLLSSDPNTADHIMLQGAVQSGTQ